MPGPRNPWLTPYKVQISDAAASGRWRRVVDVSGAQMGKTDAILDMIGHRLDQKPAPILYVGPNKQFLTEQFEPRIMALLDEAPALMRKVARGKRMTKTRKMVAGVPLRLAHGGSSTALKSDPAAFALVDEYDELLANVKGQGDPLGLVEARGDTYSDFVAVISSTPSTGAVDVEHDEKSKLDFWKVSPTDEITSAIWSLWQQGTRFHWTWPCPHCGDWFIPRFRLLKWPEGSTPMQARREAYIGCPHCGGVIEEQHKAAMNAAGVYVAPGQWIEGGIVLGEPPDSSTASFWASGLASPFKTFGERAEAFLTAVQSGEREKVQTAINAGFGELWAPGGGDVPEAAEVHRLKLPYRMGDVPAGVIVLTAGVDVQKNRLVFVVRGWGTRGTSWLILAGEIWGPTAEPDVWLRLEDMIEQRFAGLPIRMVLIDSGFRPDKADSGPEHIVYEFCRMHQRQCRPSKGYETLRSGALAVSKIEVTPAGKAAKYSLDLIRVNTDWCKLWVHERIRWPQDQPGAFFVAEDVTDDYCAQLVSEARVRKPSGRATWVRRSRNNHFLDCFDEQTQLLSQDGWLPVAEVKVGTVLATVNLDTDELEYQAAISIVARPHSGDMVSIKGRSIDLLVTPNHRMIVDRTNPPGPQSIAMAKDMTIWHRLKRTASWRGAPADAYELKENDREPAKHVEAGDWMEFLGWFVAEGHMKQVTSGCWKVVISQNPGEKHERIADLLTRMAIKYRVDGGRQFSIFSRQIFEELTDCYGPGQGRGCYRKRVPRVVKDASTPLIERFVDAAILGDGWQQNGSRTYATTSGRLADDMQELFLKIGAGSTQKERPPKPCKIRGGNSKTVPQFHVSELKTKMALLRDSSNKPLFSVSQFDGMVYCATVSNGTLVARRNGKVLIVGNCEAMAYAGGYLLGVQRIPPQKEAETVEPIDEPEAEPPAVPLRKMTPKPPRQPQVFRSSFMSR